MKQFPDIKFVAETIKALAESDAKTATKYIDEKTVVHATWRFKPGARHTREEILVTVGAPNYYDRRYIKTLKAAGEKFPVRKIKFKSYPAKKGGKK